MPHPHRRVFDGPYYPQKARLLTQLLIANGITAPGKVQAAFSATY